MDFDSYYMLSRDRPNEEWHRWTDISEVLLILLNEDSIYNIATSLITFKIIDWYAMRLWPFRGMHSYWIWVAEQVGSCNIHTIRHAWQAEFFSPGIWMIDVAKSALPDTRWTFHGAQVFWTRFSYLPTSNKHPSFRLECGEGKCCRSYSFVEGDDESKQPTQQGFYGQIMHYKYRLRPNLIAVYSFELLHLNCCIAFGYQLSHQCLGWSDWSKSEVELFMITLSNHLEIVNVPTLWLHVPNLIRHVFTLILLDFRCGSYSRFSPLPTTMSSWVLSSPNLRASIFAPSAQA